MTFFTSSTSPLVSILIAAYNEEKYINDSVTSCLNQSYDNLEVIVTDDGSTDGTIDILETILKRDMRVKIFSFPENKGKVSAFNNCFRKSSGDFITILGADDLAPSDRITKSLSPLLEKEAELICGDCVKFTSEKRLTDSAMIDDYGITGDMFFDFSSLLKKPRVFGGTIMFTRRLGEKIFPLDEFLKHEDWWIPLAAAARQPVKYLHHTLCYYRIHENNEKEINLINAEFDVWRIKSQKRKVIHYQKVISEFDLSSDQIKYVNQKKLIHELMLETRASSRLLSGLGSIGLLFNRCLDGRDKLKFLATWLAPKLAFRISKLMYKRSIGKA